MEIIQENISLPKFDLINCLIISKSESSNELLIIIVYNLFINAKYFRL